MRVSIILKMLIFHSFKASGSTFSRLHQRLLKSFKEAAVSLRHLGKSILDGNLYLEPLEIYKSYIYVLSLSQDPD